MGGLEWGRNGGGKGEEWGRKEATQSRPDRALRHSTCRGGMGEKRERESNSEQTGSEGKKRNRWAGR